MLIREKWPQFALVLLTSVEKQNVRNDEIYHAIIIINSIHLVNLLITFIFSLSDEVDKQDLLKEHADNNEDDGYRVRKV